MTDTNLETAKPVWETPVIVTLDLDMSDVENGIRLGADGASPGNNTSLS